jgi:membrane protein DedA with SNARE-associated domain
VRHPPTPFTGAQDKLPVVPDRHRSRRRLGILLAAFATLSTLSIVGTVLSARLVNHAPALLLALAPANRHLLLTSAAGINPFAYVLAAGVRYIVGGTVLYLLGRDYGEACRAWFERQPGGLPGSVRWIEKGFDAAWWVVVPVMVGSNAARLLAGARNLPARTYGALLGVGIAGRLALFWYLGQRFKVSLERVLDFIDRYQWWIIAAFVVVTVFQSYRKTMAAERAKASLAEVEVVEAASEIDAG